MIIEFLNIIQKKNMGTWGTKLYQDDVAQDVRDFYTEQLRRGQKSTEITKQLIKQYEGDIDDEPIFWFALADTQWSLGRLEKLVKEKALYYIQSGEDIERWKTQNPKEAKKREEVLFNLQQKLLAPQPEEKKIRKYRIYQCEWKIGDVYAYPLKSDFAKEKGFYGRYFLLHKIDETTIWPGHVVPVVRVKITKDKNLPENEKQFDQLEYVQTFVTSYEDRLLPFDGSRPYEMAERLKKKYEVDEFGFLPEYRIKLCNTSKRRIPKDIFFLSNFQNVIPPKREFVPHSDINIREIEWENFDEVMIDRYLGYNLRQYKIYSK